MDQKLEKWKRWVETIASDVEYLLTSRYILKETAAIVRSNDSLPKTSSFLKYFEIWYADSMIVGVRRQVKTNDDSISLARLLDDMLSNPEIISRDYYRSFSLSGAQDPEVDAEFDKIAAPGKDHIDPDIIENDLNRLKQLAKSCEAFGDRQVAHLDKRGAPNAPTYKELDETLNLLEVLLQKYKHLVTGMWLLSAVAYIQDDWKAIFRQAWICPE